MGLIFRLVLVLLLTISIIRTNTIFLKHSIFKVKEVKIEGGSKNLIKSLLPLKEELIGKSINNMDFLKIEKKISEDIRVEKVAIKREGINKISIEIYEKIPKCYVQYKNNVYIIDKNGEIFNCFNDLEIKDFPSLVINMKQGSLEKQVDILLKVFNKIERTDFKDVISQFYIESPSLIKFILVDGTGIKTNKLVTKEKYDIGSYLYFNLSSKKKLEYIDLRYEDYVVKYMEDKNGK